MVTDTETKLIADSIRHCEMIVENCDDTELRNSAINDLVSAYRYTNRYDEAKKYAEMYPTDSELSRDEVFLKCLRGEELDKQRKKIIRKSLMKLCGNISNLWQFAKIPFEEAMDVEEKVIKAVITDGNYQLFHINLSFINLERAKIAMQNGKSTWQ